jgi:hypothetical protein
MKTVSFSSRSFRSLVVCSLLGSTHLVANGQKVQECSGASREAEIVNSELFTECPGGRIFVSKKDTFACDPGHVCSVVTEYAQASISKPRPAALTPAEQLNGTECGFYVDLDYTATRHRWIVDGAWHRWEGEDQPWSNRRPQAEPAHAYAIVKTKGAWSAILETEFGALPVAFEGPVGPKVDCVDAMNDAPHRSGMPTYGGQGRTSAAPVDPAIAAGSQPGMPTPALTNAPARAYNSLGPRPAMHPIWRGTDGRLYDVVVKPDLVQLFINHQLVASAEKKKDGKFSGSATAAIAPCPDLKVGSPFGGKHVDNFKVDMISNSQIHIRIAQPFVQNPKNCSGLGFVTWTSLTLMLQASSM